MNTASRLHRLHRRAWLACVAGGLPASVLWAQDRPVQAPLPALWWPPERHWQLLRERAPQSPEVQAVMKAQYQLLARGWSQPPRALAHLPAEPHRQGEAPPRRVADSLGEFEQLQALAFLFTISGQAAYRDRALELLRPWARSLGPVAQPLALRWLEPAVWAYRLLRPHIGSADRARLDAWWQAHALAQQGDRQLDRPDALDRRNSHRLCNIGLIGWALGDASLVESARRGLQQQLMDDLLPTGESLDHRQSGRLADQVDALRPLLTLALALPRADEDVMPSLRFGNEMVAPGGELVLQFGYTTAPADDRADLPPLNLGIVIDRSGRLPKSAKIFKTASQVRVIDRKSVV